jgi:hypothetical protein
MYQQLTASDRFSGIGFFFARTIALGAFGPGSDNLRMPQASDLAGRGCGSGTNLGQKRQLDAGS